VDDEKELISTICERMAMRNISATAALSGPEAIQRIRKVDYDVVVLDVKMPGMSGLETLRAIKKNKPHLPVIMMTGHGSIQDSQKALREGASNYLMKPVEFDDLLEKINAAINEQQSENNE
jgi:DNA-binding NtrC family response regulator